MANSTRKSQLLSESMKRLWRDPAYRKKMSDAHKGKTPWNKGTKNVPSEIRDCEICEKSFSIPLHQARQRAGRFCGNECRNNYFASFKKLIRCLRCKKELSVRRGSGQVFCSRECYWESLSEATKPVAPRRYVSIRTPDGRRMDEHRYVMEKHLGRRLSRKEIVHHKDGDSTNNKLENLEVLTQSEHIKKHFNGISFKDGQ